MMIASNMAQKLLMTLRFGDIFLLSARFCLLNVTVSLMYCRIFDFCSVGWGQAVQAVERTP